MDDLWSKGCETIHPVEKQWHYAILTHYGFVPKTKEAVGWVRSYDYYHPATGHEIRMTTGAHADYWRVEGYVNTGKCYWADLEPYLKTLDLP